MKPLRITGQFKKDIRACKKRGFRMHKLENIIDKLRGREALSLPSMTTVLSRGPGRIIDAVIRKAIGCSSTGMTVLSSNWFAPALTPNCLT
jgi:hypothetical protein